MPSHNGGSRVPDYDSANGRVESGKSQTATTAGGLKRAHTLNRELSIQLDWDQTQKINATHQPETGSTPFRILSDVDSYFKLPPYIESPTVFSWAFLLENPQWLRALTAFAL